MGALLCVCMSGGLLGFARMVLTAALSIATPVATHVTCLGMEAFPSADQLLSDSLLFHCYLFRESGNCKSIWNSIFLCGTSFKFWHLETIFSHK